MEVVNAFSDTTDAANGTPSTGDASSGISHAMDAESEVLCLNYLVTEYEETGEAQKLKPLLAESFTLENSDGSRLDRQAFLSSLDGGKGRGRRIEKPQVQLAGDMALYTCEMQTAAGARGASGAGRLKNIRVLTRVNGQWRLNAWKVEPIPDTSGNPPIPTQPPVDSLASGAPDPAAVAQLKEMVLDHLGIPRPGQREQVELLQNNHLPVYLQTARQAWMQASALPLSYSPDKPDPYLTYLNQATSNLPGNIRDLNSIFETLGIQALMEDMASSPSIAALAGISPHPYEARVLQAAGHPHPQEAALEYQRMAAENPKAMSAPGVLMEEAAGVSQYAQQVIINNFNFGPGYNQPAAAGIAAAPAGVPSPASDGGAVVKPKNRKVWAGLGELCSGLALATGNAIFIPSIPFTAATVLPIAGSLASGFAAIGKGIADMKGEAG